MLSRLPQDSGCTGRRVEIMADVTITPTRPLHPTFHNLTGILSTAILAAASYSCSRLLLADLPASPMPRSRPTV